MKIMADAKVIIGDSIGPPITNGRYWSDRITETLARRGLLTFGEIDGLVDEGFVGTHIGYKPGDVDDALAAVDIALKMPKAESDAMRAKGRKVVEERHTYQHRMTKMIAKL
jgi:hypothetical protein